LISLGLVFVEVSVASAGSSWSSPSDIDGSNTLGSVSCPSASFCTAVDDEGHALIYNGSSWSSPSDIDTSNRLSSVSCPSASLCTAVDDEGHALTYNGSSWSSPSKVDTHELTSVSCPSATFCAAVDTTGNALTYNGSSWSSPLKVANNELISVSCPSASFCAAVDVVGNALTYNGTTWSSPSDVDGSNLLISVSCPSASFCAAVDVEGNAFTYNGSSWSSPSDVDGSNILVSVSCPSATFCAAIDTTGHALTYNGSSWSSPSDIDGSNFLISASCPSATFCAAVDTTGNALTYNGSSVSTPPATTVVLPVSGTTLAGSTYLDAYTTNAASVEFRLFGGSYGFSGPVVCTAIPTIYGWLCAWVTTAVPNGSYTLVSEAFNSAGSTFSAGVNITVDNLPTTSVLVPANDATLTGTADLAASASNAASVEFRLFGGSYGYSGPVVCTASLTFYGWLCEWNTATVPSGFYALLSEAFNSVGSAFSFTGVNISVVN
jgi:hypothetical protein